MRVLRTSLVFTPLLALAAVLIGLPSMALGQHDRGTFSTRLNGYNETPSLNTDGRGTFKLTISDTTDITFVLTYQDLTTSPTVSHIHLGQARTSGGVMIWLCGGGGQPDCPTTTSGTLRGSITPANVTGPAGQGIAAGDLTSALRAIRAGAAYANLHTTRFGGGEIRGQLRGSDDDKDDPDTDQATHR
jgi:hypothetical protein